MTQGDLFSQPAIVRPAEQVIDLAAISRAIREEQKLEQQSNEEALGHAICQGELLRKAREAFRGKPKGSWSDWLKENFDGAERTAQRLIQVAKNLPEIKAHAKASARTLFTLMDARRIWRDITREKRQREKEEKEKRNGEQRQEERQEEQEEQQEAERREEKKEEKSEQDTANGNNAREDARADDMMVPIRQAFFAAAEGSAEEGTTSRRRPLGLLGSISDFGELFHHMNKRGGIGFRVGNRRRRKL